ncbi:unnamed protein product [Calypogeia fissa]
MTNLGYSADMPRPCNTAIQVTIASIRAKEIHQAIQTHEHAVLASLQSAEPGHHLMKFLGFDEWFSIYLVAQKQGVQAALNRLQEYTGFLDCLEGDDAFELQRQKSVVQSFEAALSKAAVDTAIAKKEAENPPPPSPAVACNSGSPIVSSPIIPHAISLGSASGTTPNLVFSLLSTSDSPSASVSVILLPNLSAESSTSCSRPISVIPDSVPPQTTPGDLRSCISENPLLGLTWLTEDEVIDMKEAISTVDCSPVTTTPPDLSLTD